MNELAGESQTPPEEDEGEGAAFLPDVCLHVWLPPVPPPSLPPSDILQRRRRFGVKGPNSVQQNETLQTTSPVSGSGGGGGGARNSKLPDEPRLRQTDVFRATYGKNGDCFLGMKED